MSSFFYSKCIFFVLLVTLTVSKRWWVQATLVSVIPLHFGADKSGKEVSRDPEW
jgi:hypothetical protein